MGTGTPSRTTKSAGAPALHDSLVVLAHELRNPLMLIRAEIAMLRRDNPARPSVLESCAVVDHQLTQLAALVGDVARMAGNREELLEDMPELDLRHLIHGTIADVTGLVESRGVELAVDVGPDPLLVRGSAVRLTQALTNLLVNAAKFTEPGGAIVVIAGLECDWIEVSIRDTGCGIPVEVLDAVFDPFVRASTSDDGSGIGLVVAQRVVAAHGGSLQGRSDGVGQGSEFIIRLPPAAPDSFMDAR